MSQTGDNTGREKWLKHQAIAILDEERRATLNAEVGKHRKQAKADDIELADLDWTIKVIKWPVGEIADFFKRRLTALSHNNINVSAKIDEIFGGQTEDQRYAGVLAGMQGKLCSPPANFTPNEKQTWIDGWHEGNKGRDAALFDLKEEQAKTDAAQAQAKAEGADLKVDKTTEAAATLGDADYGDDPAAPTPGAAAAPEPKVEGDTQAQTGASPHQPARKPRAKKSAAAVH